MPRKRKHVLLVVGARPNFVKAAALYRALRARRIRVQICHTGQHYDSSMSGDFFRRLGLPRPAHFLGIGSGTHGQQTARAMAGIEKALVNSRPGLMVVVGDVNSTMAGALAGAKLHVPVAHVEAGLRSFDRRMPEEINRIVTDAVADYHFVTEKSGLVNLRREGADMRRVFFCGNVMIDTLLRFRPAAGKLGAARKLGLAEKGFALATLHRPANVDSRASLRGIVRALAEIGKRLPVVLAAHPRTQKKLKAFGLGVGFGKLSAARRSGRPQEGLWLLPPQDYLVFFSLLLSSRLVLTDSGGLQEETSVLGVPCLTLRENTERPVTLRLGTSRLVGSDPERIVRAARAALTHPRRKKPIPLWDGKAGPRIAKHISHILRSL